MLLPTYLTVATQPHNNLKHYSITYDEMFIVWDSTSISIGSNERDDISLLCGGNVAIELTIADGRELNDIIDALIFMGTNISLAGK